MRLEGGLKSTMGDTTNNLQAEPPTRPLVAQRHRGSEPLAGPSEARAADILSEVAAQLEGQADEIALTMVEAYESEIPAYAAITDQALVDDVHSVSSAMVRCWLTVMSSGVPVREELLVPLLEGARRRAAQGFEMQSMLRAFRIGIRVMWSEITASPAWRGRPLQTVMAQVATWVLGFADQICTGVAAAYMDEAARVARERAHRRSALLNVILAGPGFERFDGPEELGAMHCVVVARMTPDLSLADLDATGQILEDRAGAVLWTVRYCSVVAAISLPDRRGRPQVAQRLGRLVHAGRIVAIGVGGWAEGVAETRQSYAEAVDALRVGPYLRPGVQPVYDYPEFAPVIALLRDPDRARRFVAEALAPLGDLVERDWVLPTIEAYLVRQGRLKEVAASLDIHQSTVKYRINEIRPCIDLALRDGERAATLLLALHARRLLSGDAWRPDRGGVYHDNTNRCLPSGRDLPRGDVTVASPNGPRSHGPPTPASSGASPRLTA
jgi:hypothetical protein